MVLLNLATSLARWSSVFSWGREEDMRKLRSCMWILLQLYHARDCEAHDMFLFFTLTYFVSDVMLSIVL